MKHPRSPKGTQSHNETEVVTDLFCIMAYMTFSKKTNNVMTILITFYKVKKSFT